MISIKANMSIGPRRLILTLKSITSYLQMGSCWSSEGFFFKPIVQCMGPIATTVFPYDINNMEKVKLCKSLHTDLRKTWKTFAANTWSGLYKGDVTHSLHDGSDDISYVPLTKLYIQTLDLASRLGKKKNGFFSCSRASLNTSSVRSLFFSFSWSNHFCDQCFQAAGRCNSCCCQRTSTYLAAAESVLCICFRRHDLSVL